MSAILDAGETEANPDVYLPDYLEGTSTKADFWGVWILVLTGECSCGHRKRRVAPDWKVPEEWGGAWMTSQCRRCLGTMEFDDEWEPVEDVVRSYSDLRPAESDSS